MRDRAHVIKLSRPTIKTVYQLAAQIMPGGNEKDTYNEAIQEVLEWLHIKWPDRNDFLRASQSRSFVLDQIPGRRLETVEFAGDPCWAARLEHPEEPMESRPARAGRVWTVDVSVKCGRPISVGVKVAYADSFAMDGDASEIFSRPGIIRKWAEKFDLMDVRPILGRAALLLIDELQGFHDFICNPNRRLPVIVLTQPDSRKYPELSPFVIDPTSVAESLLGVAHVVQLPNDASWRWTEMVGKPWSAYMGAVRIYLPGLDFANQTPHAHPLDLVEHIMRSSRENLRADDAYAAILVEKVRNITLSHRMPWDATPFIRAVRAKVDEHSRQSMFEDFLKSSTITVQHQEDMVAIKEAQQREINGFKSAIKDMQGAVDESLGISYQMQQERDVAKVENYNLRRQISGLREKLQADGKNPDDRANFPDAYEDIPDWASKQLAGRLELHPRAINALKDAQYESLKLVCDALLLLSNEYHAMRCAGGNEKRLEFEERLGNLGLKLARSISKENASQEGEEYFVRWPTNGPRKRFMEWHLRKGSDKNDKHCLAIYFFWDDDDSKVIVGSLPAHLDNRMT